MKTVLISGVCGFVGSSLAKYFRHAYPATELELVGFDNLTRPGAWSNLQSLKSLDVQFHHLDVRSVTDLDSLPKFDWVIDAAANPSVLAGTTKASGSRSLMETNLIGTLNLLELCKCHSAGMVLLSTSRVYGLDALCNLPLKPACDRFVLDESCLPEGVSARGVQESFSTQPPVSLYGCSKLASESLATEYSLAYDFPVWINRCGVLAGAGQFGKPDQGIFAFWLHSWREKQPLRYIGFNGSGHQVRDCLHPEDLFRLVDRQIQSSNPDFDRVINVSGGCNSARSLKMVSDWCKDRWGTHEVNSASNEERPYDIPWIVLDSSKAAELWDWQPEKSTNDILEEIADFADENPSWLKLSST
ncbi:NAD-dependent epimerase/dehydratase family protein [Rhodopirellula halodulae]|uniref:NAD-dependent epimerase/dehydratase family protein n=1 Tax=Rhodopirellula halodulae TaxID=2894198 RepID=UPI001E566587|nr:NAD-dependent epimerase/dehydratase family protein [Rhodopirellula sp. JC737]MCC9654760.1 NAD-dependent epimerase/dehydratase family protein [Rhodopirellula sp. JC737]